MRAAPEVLWTSRGHGLSAAVAMMYAPTPLPVNVRTPRDTRDLQRRVQNLIWS